MPHDLPPTLRESRVTRSEALTRTLEAEIAGTAIITNVGAGLLGAGVYLRSGQLRERSTRRLACALPSPAR